MEFPSKGIWSIVFVTGEAASEITSEIPGRGPDQRVHADRHAAAVRLRVLRAAQGCAADEDDVEDAAKIIISAGMVNPETQARLQGHGGRPQGASTRPASPASAAPSQRARQAA